MTTRQEKIQIANTIIEQLGGYGKLKAMTGAKDLVALDSGVQFGIGKNCNNINKVRIVLTSLDLYELQFLSIRKKRNTWDWAVTVKAEYSQVYADQLVDLFEEATGMYLAFMPRVST